MPSRVFHPDLSSPRDYALPRLGTVRVDSVTNGEVMAVLLPVWSTKRETARQLDECARRRRHPTAASQQALIVDAFTVD